MKTNVQVAAYAANEFYSLAKKYGTCENDYKNESEGTGSDHCVSGHDINKYTVKSGSLELIVEEGRSWSSYGTYEVSGSESSFSRVEYRKDGRTLFSARKNNGGERYEDHLLSGRGERSEKVKGTGWDIEASGNVQKRLPKVVESLKKRLAQRERWKR
jgi:hypothetical protein